MALLAACDTVDDATSHPMTSDASAPRAAAEDTHLNELVPDAAVTDVDGRTWRLSALLGKRGLLIAIRDSDCPLSRKYGPRLARIEAEYGARGVRVLYLNPTRQNPVAAIRAEIATFGFGGRYVHEPEARLAAMLGARTSTEVFLLDSRRTLVYRGAIDDQYGLGFTRPAVQQAFLLDALEDHLAGRAVRVPMTSAPGCLLGLEPAPWPAARVTWANQVSRIVQRHCVECHRTGGLAPFPLVTRQDVSGRGAMIHKVVREGRMPPWFAGPTGGPWANDRSLSEREKQALLHWLEEGAPPGDPAEAPLPRRFAEEWDIGTPDLVLEVPHAQAVPAEGLIPYRYAAVDVDLPEDRWVQAVQLQTTAKANVHHVLVFLERRDRTRVERLFERFTGDGPIRRALETHFAAYAPGYDRAVYPPGTAKRLPARARLIFQIHYLSTGVAAQDRPRLGLVFAKRPPRHEVVTASAANGDFRIPAGAPNHEVSGTHTFDRDGLLLAFGPHMHYRGKAFRFRLVRPGGEARDLLAVPRYTFDWQIRYELARPIVVATGSRLVATGWFDNSHANPANPDPTRSVSFGLQSTDEMMIGYFDWIPGAVPAADAPE